MKKIFLFILLAFSINCSGQLIINSFTSSSSEKPLITSWNMVNLDILVLPLSNLGGDPIDAFIDWGDGSPITNYKETDPNDDNKTHQYLSTGIFDIEISGIINLFQISVLDASDEAKIVELKQWGTITPRRIQFRNAINMIVTASDIPDWSGLGTGSGFADLFNNCPSVTNVPNINLWDVSFSLNFSGMFTNSVFNQDISDWDVSNGTNFRNMFSFNTVFDQPLGNWTLNSTSNVSLQQMFQGATGYDQSFADWNMEKVNNIKSFMSGSGIGTTNYDATLISWAGQTVVSGLINVIFTNSQFTLGGLAETSRTSLINDDLWVITDAGGI